MSSSSTTSTAIHTSPNTVQALQLSLHGHSVGVLLHYNHKLNHLVFDPTYSAVPINEKPIITLPQLMSETYLAKPQVSRQRLTPLLSNLLPEGVLREWLSKTLKVDINNEFAMLAYTGRDLSGALVATPMEAGAIPAWAHYEKAVAINVKTPTQIQGDKQGAFSLAGVQIKFSSTRRDGRYNINNHQGDDSWIIKTPSTLHKHTPENEYSAMRLAQTIGVNIPDIALVPLNHLDNLPDIELPNESFAYAIKRFDRAGETRIHTEDFAQIMEVYAQDKYSRANYEQIAKAINDFSITGLADVQQMARRLLANILLANGDAHLKNWTLYYPNKMNSQLSPAYDIVSTLPYISNETQIALNMAKTKEWHEINYDRFNAWAERAGLAWPAIQVHLKAAIEAARDQWPEQLKDLPMMEEHKQILKKHWAMLHKDFKVT